MLLSILELTPKQLAAPQHQSITQQRFHEKITASVCGGSPCDWADALRGASPQPFNVNYLPLLFIMW